MNYLRESWAELKAMLPKIKFSNKEVSQAYWVFMFRIGPDWNKSIIPIATQDKRRVYSFVWECRIGWARVKKGADVEYTSYIFDQQAIFEGHFIYKNFKFI